MTKEIVLPEGFEVDKIEDGKIILKEVKSKYPKTWEECMQRTTAGEYISNISYVERVHPGHFYYPNNNNKLSLPIGYGKKVLALCQLLICRNVYWEGWRPNWQSFGDKYCIDYSGEEIRLCTHTVNHRILAFPTKEMLDIFYENFRDLIEEAKDLL